MAEGVDTKEVLWSAFHYQDEDGTWCAGVEVSGIPNHDKAVEVAQVVETAVAEFLEKIRYGISLATH